MAEAATEQSIEKVTAELVKQTGLSQERVIDMKKQSDALKEQKKSLDAMKKGLETLGKVAERDAAYQKASNKYEKDKSSLEKKDQRISIKDRFTSIKNAAKDFKTQSNISKGITGLKTEFKSGLKGLGGSLASLGGFAKKSAGGILSFIGKAALFTFLPAIIGFLQSPLFEEMIDYITSTLVPAVFDLYNNIILPLGKALFELGPGPLGLLALGTYLTVKLLPKVFGLLPNVIAIGKAFVQIGFGLTKVALRIGVTLAKYGLQKAGGALVGILGKGLTALSSGFTAIGKGVIKAGGSILKSVPKLFSFENLKTAFFALDSRVEKTTKGIMSSIKGMPGKVMTALGGAFTAMKTFFMTSHIPTITAFLAPFAPLILGIAAVTAAIYGVYKLLTETEIGEKILGAFKDMFDSVIGFITGIYTNNIKPSLLIVCLTTSLIFLAKFC